MTKLYVVLGTIVCAAFAYANLSGWVVSELFNPTRPAAHNGRGGFFFFNHK